VHQPEAVRQREAARQRTLAQAPPPDADRKKTLVRSEVAALAAYIRAVSWSVLHGYGDTLSVKDAMAVKIRLHGIEYPEKDQPFTNRAKQFLSELCFGKDVTVKPRGQDRYRRTVANVMLPDGRNLNHEIVRAGFAWWFQRYALTDTELKKLEAEAREARRGLWADPEPVPPWEWRAMPRQHGPRAASGATAESR
jgi:micrococcal nuclease